MAAPLSTEGGPRTRTRRAILEAAMVVLAENGTASLADIASAAEVGRSTLHRYFPERSGKERCNVLRPTSAAEAMSASDAVPFSASTTIAAS